MRLTAVGSFGNFIDARPQVVLVAGATILYAASRAAVEAAAGSSPAPGRRAVAHWVPIAAAAAWAAARGEPGLAVAVVFATSIGALALATGCVAILNDDPAEPPVAPARWRRAWPFLLPAALLTLLAGFSGRFTHTHAVVLAAEGAALLYVWLDPSPSPSHADDEKGSGPHALKRVEWLNVALAALLSVIGAWAAVKGALSVSRGLNFDDSGSLGEIVLGPLLVVPMILTGSALGRHGRAWAAVSTHVGVALLNLCCLLPAVITLHYLMPALSLGPDHLPRFDPSALKCVKPMVYPIVSWRVGAVVLVVLATAMLPAAAGRWRLGRGEGLAFIVIYVLYVLAVVTVGVHA